MSVLKVLCWPGDPKDINNHYLPWWKILWRVVWYPLFLGGRVASSLAVMLMDVSIKSGVDYWRH